MKILKKIILPNASKFHNLNYEIVCCKILSQNYFLKNVVFSHVFIDDFSVFKENNELLNLKNFYGSNNIIIIEKNFIEDELFVSFDDKLHIIDIIEELLKHAVKQEYKNIVRLSLYKSLLKL